MYLITRSASRQEPYALQLQPSRYHFLLGMFNHFKYIHRTFKRGTFELQATMEYDTFYSNCQHTVPVLVLCPVKVIFR